MQLPKNCGTPWKKIQERGRKNQKFFVGKFLDLKMIDSKTLISQAQEIQIILHDLLA